MDYVVGKHRGFCFVEYDDADDADEAIFNMDGAEILGRVVRVSLANPNQVNKLLSSGGAASSGGTSSTASKSEAIWKSDEWFQKHVVGAGQMEDEQERERRQAKEQDVKILQQEP